MQTKLKTLEILKEAADRRAEDDDDPTLRAEDQEDLDSDDDVASLEDRFGDINFDDEVDADVLWSRLTEEEKGDFERQMAYPEKLMVPVWQPWWRHKEPPKLVQDLHSEHAPSTNVGQRHPQVVSAAPLGDVMPKGSPSPLIPYSLVNALYAYAATTRLHNGDHLCMPDVAAEVAMQVCGTLSAKQTFPDAATSVCSAMQAVRELKAFSLDEQFPVSVLGDVVSILEGPTGSGLEPVYVSAALSDLSRLLKAASKHAKEGGLKRDPKLKMADKKLAFFMSWAQEHHGTALRPLIPNLRRLHDKYLAEAIARQLQKEQPPAKPPQQQKPLIETVS